MNNTNNIIMCILMIWIALPIGIIFISSMLEDREYEKRKQRKICEETNLDAESACDEISRSTD